MVEPPFRKRVARGENEEIRQWLMGDDPVAVASLYTPIVGQRYGTPLLSLPPFCCESGAKARAYEAVIHAAVQDLADLEKRGGKPA